MSRYTEQILYYAGIAIMAWMAVAAISAIIWRIRLKRGADYPSIRGIHFGLAVLTPMIVIIFNIITRTLCEPRTTPLWAYFITPLVAALPFLASLAGLRNAKNQSKGEQVVGPNGP